jgi:hypothetical protein
LVDLAVVVVVALPSLVPASLEDRFRLVAGRFLTAMLMLMTNDEMAHHSSLITHQERSAIFADVLSFIFASRHCGSIRKATGIAYLPSRLL